MWKAVITNKTALAADNSLTLTFDVYEEDTIRFSNLDIYTSADNYQQDIQTKAGALKLAYEQSNAIQIGEEIVLN